MAGGATVRVGPRLKPQEVRARRAKYARLRDKYEQLLHTLMRRCGHRNRRYMDIGGMHSYEQCRDCGFALYGPKGCLKRARKRKK
jgi:hypothetical protein